MPKIGPSPGGGRRGEGNLATVVPPGQYVIALVWFQRKTSESSGKDYFNGLFEICGGHHAKKTFFTVVSMNLESAGTVTRWQVWIEALGIRETFELGDTAEGTEKKGDANISRLFKGKPFAAELAVEKDDQRNDRQNIKSVIFRSKWTREQEAQAMAWIEGQSSSSPEDTAGAPPSDDDPGPPPDDDFGPTNYDDAPPRRSRGSVDETLPFEDDIPF